MLIPFGVFSAGAGATGSFDLISTTLISTNTASVTFSSLPTGYKHLQVRTVTGHTVGGDPRLRFNGDTGANYAIHRLGGQGSSVYSNAYTGVTNGIAGTNAVAGYFQAGIVDILDAFSTTKNTTVRTMGGMPSPTDKLIELWSSVWLNTAAVSSLTIFVDGGFMPSGSRLSLYGVK